MQDCVISVVIPTYNRRDVLLRCLEHLEAQTVGPDALQVLVVDDGSPDDTVPTARNRPHRFADYQVLEQENSGPGAARNRALERATAPRTIFINDDTLLAPTAIEQHLRIHAAHPMSMVLGTFEFVEAFRHEPLGRLLTEVPLLFAYPLIEDGDELSAALGATCNLSVDTNAARAVGFDPWFDFPAVEDVDFSIRLEEAGYRLRFCADAEARHDHHLTVPGIMRTSLIRGLGSARLELKRGPTDEYVRSIRSAASDPAELRRLFEAAGEELEAGLEAARHGGPIPESAYVAAGRVFRLGNLLGALDEPKIIAYANAA